MEGLILWEEEDGSVTFCSVEYNKTRYLYLKDAIYSRMTTFDVNSSIATTFEEMLKANFTPIGPQELSAWLD